MKIKISKGIETLTVEKLKGRKNVKLRAWDEVATSWFPELSIETAFLLESVYLESSLYYNWIFLRPKPKIHRKKKTDC